MTVIKVPKTPKSAFNKNRPLSNLLKAQVGILETLAAGPARAGAMAAAMPQATMPKTEGEAALYMATLAARVYPNVGVPPETAPTRAVAPVPAATTRRGAAPAKPKRAARGRKAANRSRKAVKRKGAKKVVKKSATRRKTSAVRRGNKAKTRKRRARR